MSCYVQNVRSLKAVRAVESSFESKISPLQDIVYGQDLDIISLSETWLNESVSDQEILPVSYDIYRSDRLGRSGGGTLTAIKTTLSSSQVPIPSDFSSLEMVVVEIGSLKNDRSILVINCYRPPSDFDFVSRFSGFLQSLEINHYYSILAVGDFNFPNIQLVEGSGFAYSSSGEEASFTSLLMDYYLFQLVEHPTRGNNILDLLITNTPTFITAGPMTGPQWSDTGVPSDHFPVILIYLWMCG